MKENFLDIRTAEDMPNLVDNTIALEFLISAKGAVRNNAIALTECTSVDIRNSIKRELEYSLNLHEEIYLLMIKKGWFFPYDLTKQINLDIKSAQIALEIAELDLFPEGTDKLGMFTTPYN